MNKNDDDDEERIEYESFSSLFLRVFFTMVIIGTIIWVLSIISVILSVGG